MNTKIIRDKIKGRCVLAVRPFKKGELIETDHVIIFDILPEEHPLMEWAMHWTKKQDALALGHINLINHNKKRNVTIVNNYKMKTKSMYALRNIKKNEELVTNYECPIWFKVV